MMVDVEAMKRNYSKEDFVWLLENLFLITGWLTTGIHYLHSMLTAAPLIRLRSIFSLFGAGIQSLSKISVML